MLAINNLVENDLATRQDLLKSEERLTNRINEMGYKVTIRCGSMIAASVIILGTLIPIISKLMIN